MSRADLLCVKIIVVNCPVNAQDFAGQFSLLSLGAVWIIRQ